MGALIDLALDRSGKPVKIAQVAERQGIPQRYLESILNRLRQAGLVTSRRGSEGGYRLMLPPAAITAEQILRAAVGPLSPLEEADGAPRSFAPLWQRVQDSLIATLAGVTLADLVREHEEQQRSQAADWVI